MLDGLADEAEGVRDAALAAGRTAVELFAATSLPLLLPAVEAGTLSDNWRIRQSSVELLGDLLFKVGGALGCCSRLACSSKRWWEHRLLRQRLSCMQQQKVVGARAAPCRLHACSSRWHASQAAFASCAVNQVLVPLRCGC